jgi:bifunctional non-homologous end joining protein LigD
LPTHFAGRAARRPGLDLRGQVRRLPAAGAPNGHSFASRFPGLACAFREIPAKSVIIDGELVAVNSSGLPAFKQLQFRAAAPENICVYAFDLLHLDGKDLREVPLGKRRQKLRRLVERFNYPLLLFSESFDDPAALLRACEERSMEGIVSKRVDAPYRSGRCTNWVKVKSVS